MDANKIFEIIALVLEKHSELVKDYPEEIRGKGREALIQNFLEPLLPQSLGIDGGTIVSVNQPEGTGVLDIIIYDKNSYQIFKPFASFMPKKARPFPSETVYMVIEVESNLTEGRIEKLIKKCAKVKSASKTAFYEQKGAIRHSVKLYGKEFPCFPTLFIVFAYDGSDLELLYKKLSEINSKEKITIENRIDLVCILNKGLIVYYDAKEEKLNFPAEPTSELKYRQGESGENLRLLYLMIMTILTQVWTKPIKIMDYFEANNEKK